MSNTTDKSQRRRFTLWLYEDSEIELELAQHLAGLDRYRRAEFLRNITKDGWLKSQPSRKAAGAVKNTNRHIPEKMTDTPKRINKRDERHQDPPKRIVPEKSVSNSSLFKSKESENEVTDPLAALMGI